MYGPTLLEKNPYRLIWKNLFFSLISISKIVILYRIEDLLNYNQTCCVRSSVCIKSKWARFFGIASLGKKFVFQLEISSISLIIFSKIMGFYQMKYFLIWNQYWFSISFVYIDYRKKEISDVAVLWEKIDFEQDYC